MINRAVHMVSTTIRNVMSSEIESKVSSLYINAKDGVVIQNMLEEIGCPHPEIPLQTKISPEEDTTN